VLRANLALKTHDAEHLAQEIEGYRQRRGLFNWFRRTPKARAVAASSVASQGVAVPDVAGAPPAATPQKSRLATGGSLAVVTFLVLCVAVVAGLLLVVLGVIDSSVVVSIVEQWGAYLAALTPQP
jgi:hypothetical protein